MNVKFRHSSDDSSEAPTKFARKTPTEKQIVNEAVEFDAITVDEVVEMEAESEPEDEAQENDEEDENEENEDQAQENDEKPDEEPDEKQGVNVNMVIKFR